MKAEAGTISYTDLGCMYAYSNSLYLFRKCQKQRSYSSLPHSTVISLFDFTSETCTKIHFLYTTTSPTQAIGSHQDFCNNFCFHVASFDLSPKLKASLIPPPLKIVHCKISTLFSLFTKLCIILPLTFPISFYFSPCLLPLSHTEDVFLPIS